MPEPAAQYTAEGRRAVQHIVWNLARATQRLMDPRGGEADCWDLESVRDLCTALAADCDKEIDRRMAAIDSIPAQTTPET